jgi:hypothetical protein
VTCECEASEIRAKPENKKKLLLVAHHGVPERYVVQPVWWGLCSSCQMLPAEVWHWALPRNGC